MMKGFFSEIFWIMKGVKMIKYFLIPCFTFISKIFLLIGLTTLLTFQLLQIGNIIQPLKNLPTNLRLELIKRDLQLFGAPQNKIPVISLSILIASNVTNIDERIISTVVLKESNFRLTAVSNKGYKGLMQTRIASMQYPEVDIMMGAKELQKWLIYREGDLRYALASYNGGEIPPKVSWKYADEIIRIVKSL